MSTATADAASTSAATWIIIAAMVLAGVVLFASLLFARRAEHAAQRSRVSERNATTARDEMRTLHQQTVGLVAAFRERVEEVDHRPVCPMDGEKLQSYEQAAGQPARFVHADGSSHLDRMAGLAIQAQVPEQQVAQQYAEPVQSAIPSTVDLYAQRVESGIAAGLIDPDRLRTGISDITRRGWLPEPPPPDAPIPGTEPVHRRMPDPTRATRVTRAQHAQPPAAPPTPNGDGS